MASTASTNVITIASPDFTGITENIATTWAGNIRVGRISFRKLTSTEVKRINGRERNVTTEDFYYVVTLLVDSGDSFDIDETTPESAPVGIAKSFKRARDILEGIAERIEL